MAWLLPGAAHPPARRGAPNVVARALQLFKVFKTLVCGVLLVDTAEGSASNPFLAGAPRCVRPRLRLERAAR